MRIERGHCLRTAKPVPNTASNTLNKCMMNRALTYPLHKFP